MKQTHMAVLQCSLALVAVLGLVGCGGSGAASSQASTPAAPAPAPAPAPTPTPTPSAVNPNLGVNIETVTDYARALMYVDAIKSSRGWGAPQTPYCTGSDCANVPPLDANGWPLTDAGTTIYTEQADGPHMVPGTYALSFTGTATVSAPGSGQIAVSDVVYNATTNTTTADVVVPANQTQLFLTFTNTNGGIKNVKLIRPGYAGTNKTFTDEFIKLLAPFSTIRFMTFMNTPDNLTQHWADRAKPTDANQTTARGGALEYIVELANLTGKDIWINVQDQADDDYITQMATLLKNSLSPNVHVYLEWGNEMWNFGFPSTTRNKLAAIAEEQAGDKTLSLDGTDTYDYSMAMRRVAKKTVQMSNLFRQIYGDAGMNTTIRPVLANQMFNPSLVVTQLNYIKQYYGAPKQFMHALATNPYFSLDTALSQSSTLTVDQIFASLDTSLTSDVLPKLKPTTAYNGEAWAYPGVGYRAIANYYGLKTFAYEGGPDLPQSEASAPAKLSANLDPRMGQRLSQLLNQWYGCKNDLFMIFVVAGSYGGGGNWGLTNNMNNLTEPKIQAAINAAQTPPANFNSCQ